MQIRHPTRKMRYIFNSGWFVFKNICRTSIKHLLLWAGRGGIEINNWTDWQTGGRQTDAQTEDTGGLLTDMRDSPRLHLGQRKKRAQEKCHEN